MGGDGNVPSYNFNKEFDVMIKKITPSEADCIIYSRRPFGLFYLLCDGIYVGIDNSNGHAWTEDFTNLRQCKKWLLNPSMQAPLMEVA